MSATCRGPKIESMSYDMDHHVLLRLADVVRKVETILCGGHHFFILEHIILKQNH